MSEIDNTFSENSNPPRRFYLERIKDETGVSRTGRVTARLSDLRPKNMKLLFSHHKVYLCRQGDVWHLLFDIRDWAALADKFGEQVAYFDPHASMGVGGWFIEKTFHADERIPVKNLLSKIGNGEVCMLGKDCHKHK